MKTAGMPGFGSLGWEPKNIVNAQAWEVITDDLMAIVSMVRAGKRSPIAYHMAKRPDDRRASGQLRPASTLAGETPI